MRDDELIRAYFNDLASADQIRAFESRYAKDEAFRLEADQMQLELQAFRLNEREKLKHTFDKWELQSEKGKRVYLDAYWKIGIAASIVLACFIGYHTWPSNDLYEQYYEVYPNYEHTTTRGSKNTDLESAAYTYYDQQEYQKAKETFDELLSLESTPAHYLFRGVTLMELGQFEDAIADFNNIHLSEEVYGEAAQWYYSLALLKLGKTEQAIIALTQLLDSEDYQKEATDLLNGLQD